jgi:RNA polymerase sigma factor (sigma-70 family)
MRLWWRNSDAERKRRDETIEQLARREATDRSDPEAGPRGDELEALRACLERLPERSIKLVRAHFFSGVPLNRIAHEMKKTSYAVAMTFFRIRRKLRGCVEARLNLERGAK